MNRSLRTRLLLAFAAVSLPVLLLFAGGALLYARMVYLDLRQQAVKEELEANIRTHLQLEGSLSGLRPQEPPPEDQGRSPSRAQIEPPPYIVLDEAYRVVIPVTGYAQGQQIPGAERRDLTPITLDNRPVAYLLPTGTAPRPDAQTRTFLRRTAGLLLLAVGTATLLSTVLGGWLARGLLAPLRALQGGVRALTLEGRAAPLPEGQPDELGELVRAFNTMSAELERRRVASKQFSADIAHDLATPLSIVKVTLDGMQDGTLPTTSERLSRLQVQTNHLIQLSGDLRLLSLADAGDLTLNRRTVEVAELLTEVKAFFFEAARAGNVTLTIDAPPELQAVLDPLRINQVLHNLVQNGLNHTPPGGQMTLQARLLNQTQLEVSVTDTGHGIPPEHLERVFDRLYRGDDARSELGSGLGLSIARTLTEAHGGTLRLASTPGRGTAVTLTLPLNPQGGPL